MAEPRPSAGRLVLVTGAPGSGKTTLAVPLARMIGFPLISKDVVKEALDGALRSGEPDLEWSKLLGGATYEVIWRVAPYFHDLVLECNFHRDDPRHLERLQALSSRPVEIFCACPPEVAAARYAARAESRHAVHVEKELAPESLERYREPVGIGPVIVVNTAEPVDVDEVAAAVRRELGIEA